MALIKLFHTSFLFPGWCSACKLTFSMAFQVTTTIITKQFALLPLMLSLAHMTRLVHSIPTIHISGQKFFTSDGHQFFIKGLFRDSGGL
jgi:hypothetical protein